MTSSMRSLSFVLPLPSFSEPLRQPSTSVETRQDMATQDSTQSTDSGCGTSLMQWLGSVHGLLTRSEKYLFVCTLLFILTDINNKEKRVGLMRQPRFYRCHNSCGHRLPSPTPTINSSKTWMSNRLPLINTAAHICRSFEMSKAIN